MNEPYDDEPLMRILGGPDQFIQGDVACAYGALRAGCRLFAGYPITPATEIAEVMAHLLPKLGGVAIQMEDEIASISAIIGASWAGARAMTATSGPGFSLMQEGMSYACMTEAPCVIVNVQRSGPSTGQPTEPAQGDVMQARWGPHGDHEIIALAPWSVQECFDLTRRAFDLADAYRTPVLVLTDGEIGHMREKITLPAPGTCVPQARRGPTVSKEEYLPFRATDGDVPEMACFGQGYRVYVTGLTHDERGLPSTDDPEQHSRLIGRQCRKITSRREELGWHESDIQEGAAVGLVSYGISARSSAGAVRLLRSRGQPVSLLRLVTLFPFPEHAIRQFAQRLERVLVPELNLGQVCHSVREALDGCARVERISKIGGEIITPEEIARAVEGAGEPITVA